MNDDRCLICGEIVPEGRKVCPQCETLAVNARSAQKQSGSDAFMPREQYCRPSDLGCAFKCRRRRVNLVKSFAKVVADSSIAPEKA
jgi:hypothetical protein